MIPHCGFDLHFSINNVERLFLCLLASYISLKKYLCLFQFFDIFFILSYISCLYILEIKLLSVVHDITF